MVEVVPQQLVDDEQGLAVVEAVEQRGQALLLLLVHLGGQELEQLHLCRAGGALPCWCHARLTVRVGQGGAGGARLLRDEQHRQEVESGLWRCWC